MANRSLVRANLAPRFQLREWPIRHIFYWADTLDEYFSGALGGRRRVAKPTGLLLVTRLCTPWSVLIAENYLCVSRVRQEARSIKKLVRKPLLRPDGIHLIVDHS